MDGIEFSSSIRPACLSISKIPIKTTHPLKDEGTATHEEVQMLLGTYDGKILIFDPILRGKNSLKKYTNDSLTQPDKKKSVEMIKWIEKNNGEPADRFIAVFSDGVIAIYHKDKEIP